MPDALAQFARRSCLSVHHGHLAGNESHSVYARIFERCAGEVKNQQHTPRTLPETVVVTLKNNARQRREWLDADLTDIVGRAVFLELSDGEKTLVNWIAANGPMSVSQANRLIGGTWPKCKAILQGLVNRGILRYETKPQPQGISDKHAKFVLNRPTT